MGRGKLWNRLVQWIIVIIVLGELTSFLILDRLDGVVVPASIRSLSSWKRLGVASSNFKFPGDGEGGRSDDAIGEFPDQTNCEAWLEEADRLPTARNFTTDPVVLLFAEAQRWPTCGVGCDFRASGDVVDGDFRRGAMGSPNRADGISHVLRSMEPASYYPLNNLVTAHQSGYDVVMTTSLASDVPAGYFSWAEYDLMAPARPKDDEDLVAAAFISNCAANNFRLEALEELRKLGVSVDSFGKCHRTRPDGNKLEILRRYKFSLAFENSNEEDYVSEKFWQSLVAGSVPVVVGAPNIEDFAPAPNAFLHIKSMQDVSRVASQMKYLAANTTAYNETLAWKLEGPSNAFKALVDMAAVHSSCRLCIHLATSIRTEEEKKLGDAVDDRPCSCTDASGSVTYHVYVRERGRFEFESVFVRSTELSIEGLEAAVLAKFRSLGHIPIWYTERPEVIRGDGTLIIYKLYPVGLTQRDALYSVYFQTDDNVKGHLDDNPCPKLEVIFI